MQAFSERHRLALAAALLKDERGLRAYRDWEALVGINGADDTEFRILPLIYRRLIDREEEPDNRLKGVYRHVWSTNTMLIGRSAPVVRLLGESRIETMLLRGIAMVACWQQSVGPRFVGGADLLVRRRDAREAIRRLSQAGWTADIAIDRLQDAALDRRSAMPMRYHDGSELTLHWRALPGPAGDEVLWAASQPIDVMGRTARRLTLDDHLYYTLIDGASRGNGTDLDPIVDAVSLMQVDESINRRAVLRHVERDRSRDAVERQLELLRDEIGFETPLLREVSQIQTGARTPRPRHLPDEQQALLLQAALAERPIARQAWMDWHAASGSGHVDPASERILPLVYTRLRNDDSLPGMPRLRETYRRSWLKNRGLLHLTRPAIATLQAAGHPVMLIKGMSLLLRYYADSGARVMGDVDLLVKDADAPAALDELLRHGWVSSEPDQPAHDVFARHHAVNLTHPAGGHIDLHRRMLADSPPNAEGRVWEAAEQVSVEGLSVLVPSAADELLLACIHGWHWNPVASIRWIHDAAVLASHMNDEADWTRLVDEAKHRQLSFRLSRALRALHDDFDVAVPANVLARIERGPFAPFEIAEERVRTSPPGLLPPALARAYFAQHREVGPPRGAGWWIRCVRRTWAMRNPPSGLHLFPWMANWARRRLVDGARSATRQPIKYPSGN